MSDLAAVASPTTVRRPVLIDTQDGPCEICGGHVDGICDGCGSAIPVYENMGGSGYQGVKPNHFHLEMVSGGGISVPGRRSFHYELCVDCYRKDWMVVYGTEPPV